MLSILSRGGPRVRQTYICSSCRCNILAHTSPQQAHLPLPNDRATRAAAGASNNFSTSARQLIAGNGEPDVSEPSTGDDSNPHTKSVEGKRKETAREKVRPEGPLSKSKYTLRALRDALLSKALPPRRKSPITMKKVPLLKRSIRGPSGSADTKVSGTSETANHTPILFAPQDATSGGNGKDANKVSDESTSERAEAIVLLPDKKPDKKLTSSSKKSKKSRGQNSTSPKLSTSKGLKKEAADAGTTTTSGKNRSWTVVGEDGRKVIVTAGDTNPNSSPKKIAKASRKAAKGDNKSFKSPKSPKSPKTPVPKAADGIQLRRVPSRPRKQPGTTAHEIKTIDAKSLHLVPIDTGPLRVPPLSHGLERVLFNPGVYQLQDPRSRVFNFNPYLQSIMPVSEFDFNALKKYVTSSQDKNLISKAIKEKKKYAGSSSSTTSALAHFHFLLSQWRDISLGNLSKMFPAEFKTFTALQRGPTSIFLRWRDGAYAIDADRQYDTANILMSLGKSMEKLLTLPIEDFEKYRKSNSDQITEEKRNASEEFHYTGIGDLLLRSQLDAHDSRLPGTGIFDLKTRAVISVRMDADAYEDGRGYEIRGQHGEWESFEREYYDMIRSAFLKYSLQVRMGRMDGIFVTYHNTERIFGFQYISLPELDFALHGTTDTTLGDDEFKLSLDLLNRVLDRATAKYPEQSLRLLFETRPAKPEDPSFMYIFAEPFTEEAIEEVQQTNKAKIESFERAVLGLVNNDYSEEDQQKEWDRVRAKVEESVGDDEAGKEALAEAKGDDDADRDPDMAKGNPDEDVEEEDNADASDSEELLEEDRELADIISATQLAEEQAYEDGDDVDVDLEKSDKEADLEEIADLEATAVAESEELMEDAKDSDLEESEESEEDIETTEESLFETDDEEPAESEDIADAESEEVEQSEGPKTDTSDDSSSDIDGSSDSRKAPAGQKEPPKPRDMIAMTLTICNKVNGAYVHRPCRLEAKHNWKVEYTLSEIQDPLRVAKLYEMAKTRRKRASTKTNDLNKDSLNNLFLQRIKDMNKKGREWRRKQKEIDGAFGTKVLDVSLDGAVGGTGDEERKI